MRKLSLHSACALVIALALVGYALPPTGLAQNSAGNTPLTRPAHQLQAESGPSAGSPVLRADSRPIKVDVSLVLVSVSVVDPLNREVVGLDKENFEVLEGKEKQVIRHFSGEDAPISLGVISAVAKLRDHISGRELELLQERGESRVVVQVLQQGGHFGFDQTGVTLGISSV